MRGRRIGHGARAGGRGFGSALKEEGPALGRPLVDTIKGSVLSNLKELRPGSAGTTEVRLLFVFDPDRQAVILVGGDKAGNWSDWYRVAVPQAEQAYAEHLKAQVAGTWEHDTARVAHGIGRFGHVLSCPARPDHRRPAGPASRFRSRWATDRRSLSGPRVGRRLAECHGPKEVLDQS